MSAIHGQRVKERILVAGLELWPNASARAIGRRLGMTHGAILYHYRSIEALRSAIAQHAVSVGDARVVPMLITAGHEAAAAVGPSERRRYLLNSVWAG